jgi:hypothetical protein
LCKRVTASKRRLLLVALQLVKFQMLFEQMAEKLITLCWTDYLCEWNKQIILILSLIVTIKIQYEHGLGSLPVLTPD